MYELYFHPNACSLATQIILREINQPFKLILAQESKEFEEYNPLKQVPVLVKNNTVLKEGAAILIHLLKAHDNNFVPKDAIKKHKMIEQVLFANATMHPAYSKLFFIEQHISDSDTKIEAFIAATHKINQLWSYVNEQLKGLSFLGGESASPADILLTVYSRWGAYFPEKIHFGAHAEKMIDNVLQLQSFKDSLNAEEQLVKTNEG